MNNKYKNLPKERLIKLHHKERKSISEISVIVGIPRKSLKRMFDRLKIETLSRSDIATNSLDVDIPKDKLTKLYYKKKYSLVKLSEYFNCSLRCINKRFSVWNLKKRDQKKPKISKKHGLLIKRYEKIKNNHNVIPMFTIDEYTPIRKNGKNTYYKWKCAHCGKIFLDYLHSHDPMCNCRRPKYYGTSVQEKEIFNFVKSTTNEKVKNGKRFFENGVYKYEIDVYVPKMKTGIEFNGLRWHGDVFGQKDKHYHINKTNYFKNKGIRVIHVFENEWNDKQEIVKSVIKSKLGLITNKIFARKCEIRDVGVKEKNEFLNNNHLQGKDRSKIKLGLYHNNELVALLTFGKPRFNKKYDWEIIRYANKINTSVVGGFSRLLKHFRKHNFGTIITYADKRYSDGGLYKNNGFKELKDSAPNYFYFKNKNIDLESRNKYQKHKLSKLLNKFDSNLTEWENMQNNGYDRIWDCGNKVFVMN